MLIVCPNCATSYMIDAASVGPSGRAVRCARCKTTWFATAPGSAAAAKVPPPAAASNVSAFVDGVIAEAEAQSGGPPERAGSTQDHVPPTVDSFDTGMADDFGGAAPHDVTAESSAAFDAAARDTDPALPEPSADAVNIADAPSLVPALDHEAPSDGQAAREAEDIESFAVRRERMKARRKKAKRSSRWTAAILVLFAINVALIGARSEVVRYLPQTASLFAAVGLPVNLRDLRFDKVKIVKEAQDGVSILIIEGRIENIAGKPTEVPRLRFAARNTSGQEVYTWTALPDRSILGAGESMPFRSRLAAPPADATDVMVRFFNAQDTAGGAGKK